MRNETREMIRVGLLVSALTLLAAGCGGRMPEDLGPQGVKLGPCPDSPNCVSSAATDEGHAIAPIAIVGEADAAWAALGASVGAMPRTEIVKEAPGYLQAVQTSALMRYRDDFEFLLNRDANAIEVRSASRVGYGDMGVNRARIEAVRAALVAKGVAAAAP